ncbi:MAG TPA: hypothetical protein VFZ87_09185 [Gemmatimonadales bacterium]
MTIWIEEAETAVWHRVSARVADGYIPAACGWRMNVHHGRIWPVKPNAPGPPDAERCHSCGSSA